MLNRIADALQKKMTIVVTAKEAGTTGSNAMILAQ
jgi:hypothetical protein